MITTRRHLASIAVQPQAKPQGKWMDIRQRTITIAIAAPITLLMIAAGAPWFNLLIGAVAALMAVEFAYVVGVEGRLQKAVYALLFVSVFLAVTIQMQVFVIMAVVAFLVTAFVMFVTTRNWRMSLLYPLMGAVYIGVPSGMMIVIRDMPAGRLLIFMLFLNNWMTDTGALLLGRTFGKHPLAPKISPKKSREGAILGVLVGTAVGFSIAMIGDMPILVALLVNLVLSIATVAGDLLESLFKRTFKVKDSGSLLPGHGGFLDRLDGMLVSTPVFFGLLVLGQLVGWV